MPKRTGPEPERPRTCGAKNRKGLPCSLPPIHGRNRCRYHGGRTPTGIASPHFKSGRWSKYLPQRLAEKYLQSQEDPLALSHGADLHLLDAKIADLLERAEEGGTEDRLREAVSIWDRLKRAQSAKSQDRVNACLLELDQTLTAAVTSSARTWEEIYECLELRRRTLDSEQRRLKDQRQMISVEELMVLIRFISESLKTCVTTHSTPKSARLILADMARHLTVCLARYTYSRPSGSGESHR